MEKGAAKTAPFVFSEVKVPFFDEKKPIAKKIKQITNSVENKTNRQSNLPIKIM